VGPYPRNPLKTFAPLPLRSCPPRPRAEVPHSRRPGSGTPRRAGVASPGDHIRRRVFPERLAGRLSVGGPPAWPGSGNCRRSRSVPSGGRRYEAALFRSGDRVESQVSISELSLSLWLLSLWWWATKRALRHVAVTELCPRRDLPGSAWNAPCGSLAASLRGAVFARRAVPPRGIACSWSGSCRGCAWPLSFPVGAISLRLGDSLGGDRYPAVNRKGLERT
jgi:hypothetical protein